MRGAEADLAGFGDEPGPSVCGSAQVGHCHRATGVETLGTRAFIGLDLEQLEQPGLFGGRGHHPQRAALVGQEQASRGHIQHIGAAHRHPVQEVHQVEVVDQRVGHLDECFGYPLIILDTFLPGHRCTAPSGGSGSKRSRRATTSRATSPSLRSWA